MGAKLDMGKAWNDAVALLSGNKDVVLIIAGVFFFLPNALFNLLIPQPSEPQGEITPDNIEAVYAQMGAELMEFFSSYWWLIVIVAVVQTIGVLGLMTLLTDRARPTVGEALQSGAGGVLTYFATQLLVVLAFALVLGIGFAINVTLGAVLMLPAMVLIIYVSVKLCLTSPVIALERERNPITVIKRSWGLTKSNSLRIFAFFALLILVLIVISALVQGLLGLSTLMGEGVGKIVVALGNGAFSMVTTAISVAIVASLYHQLSGGGARQAEVFD